MPRPRSMRHAACFRPGRHAALDMSRRSEPLILGRLNGHCRSLAECTVENDRLARPRELVNEAALADIVLKFAIRRVKRARNGAGPLPFSLLAQVFRGDVRAPES